MLQTAHCHCPLLQPRDLRIESIHKRAIEKGGPQQDSEAECQKHRRQGDDVVAKVDHQRAPNWTMLVRFTHAVRIIKRIGALIAITMINAKTAEAGVARRYGRKERKCPGDEAEREVVMLRK